MKDDQLLTVNKSRSTVVTLIYILIWPVLILLHFFLLGANKMTPHFWEQPESYLSTLLLDIFVIVVWYLNYYLIAPKMIRSRQFGGYMVVVGLFMILALFLPTILFYALKWGIPSNPFGTELSLFGLLAILAVMAIGLSVRGVINWLKTDDRLKNLSQLMLEKDRELQDLKEQIEKLSIEPVDPSPIGSFEDVQEFDPNTIDKAYVDLGISQKEQIE